MDFLTMSYDFAGLSPSSCLFPQCLSEQLNKVSFAPNLQMIPPPLICHLQMLLIYFTL